MDRTVMDRTAMDTFRAEEKELCDKVQKKLEKLMLIYPESLEFRKIFVEGMFLKPNQKGFFHVMQYLFTILDPAEFKKRFYWPIVDKKSEGVFRTSVVEYLIYLNKKHNLQWKQQWNYLVQMPGGNKFLTFLDDLIDFVANEIIKQNEKHIDLKKFKLDEPLTSSLIVKLKRRNQCYKKNMLNYVEALDVHTKKLKQNIEIMKKKLSEISEETGIDIEKLTDEEFCDEFSKFSNDIVNANFSKRIEKIKETTESVKIIKNEAIKFNNEKKAPTMYAEKWKNNAEKFLPNENNVSNKNEIDFTKLIEMFIKACPIVDEYLLSLDKNKLEVLQYQENELSSTHSKVLEYEQDIKQLLDSLNQELDDVKEKEVVMPSDIDPILFSKFINTPPIVNLRAENNESIVRKRLPLMENNEASTSSSHDEFSFTNQTTILFPSSAKKQFKKIEIKSASKILDRQPQKSSVDPTAFLKSLRKLKTPRRFTNKKCNEIELKQETETALTATLTSENIDISNVQNENKIIEITSKIESLKIFDSPLILTTSEKLPDSKRKLFLDIPHEMQKIVKGSPNFIKQDIGVDLEKISTSPSGRLEPLVQFNFRKSLDCSGICELDLSPQSSGGKAEPRNLFDVSNTDDLISDVSDGILKDISI